MAVTLFHERGSPSGTQASGGQGQSKSTTSAYTAQQSSAVSDQFAHLPPIEKAICDFMHSQPDSDEGIHVANIARSVQGHVEEISTALEALMDQGLVFSTIDDTHYKLST